MFVLELLYFVIVFVTVDTHIGYTNKDGANEEYDFCVDLFFCGMPNGVQLKVVVVIFLFVCCCLNCLFMCK